MWRVVFSLILICDMAEAAFESKAASVRAEGMGGAFTAVVDDPGAIFYNPAGLSQTISHKITFLRTQPFDISELEQNLISFVQPINKGGCGLSYQQLIADNNYKEEISIFSISTFLSRNLCLGVNLKHLYLKINDYGHESELGVDVGGLYKISPRIKIGVASFNLNTSLIDAEKSCNLGLSIKPTQNLLIAIDLEKTKRFNSEIKIG